MSNEFISGLWFWGFEALLFCAWWALIRYATKRYLTDEPKDR